MLKKINVLIVIGLLIALVQQPLFSIAFQRMKISDAETHYFLLDASGVRSNTVGHLKIINHNGFIDCIFFPYSLNLNAFFARAPIDSLRRRIIKSVKSIYKDAKVKVDSDPLLCFMVELAHFMKSTSVLVDGEEWLKVRYV